MIDILKIEPHTISSNIEGKCFLFYGNPGTWKTTVACNFPKPLLVAVDVGYAFIPEVKPVNTDSWATYRNIVRQLLSPRAKEMYSTVVIDGIGLLSDMCEKFILAINDDAASLGDIGWGKGWTGMKKEFADGILKLLQNGYGVVFITHADIKENSEGVITSVKPKMSKIAMELVNGVVDFTFFCKKEINESGESITYAYCNTEDSVASKARLRHLSPKFVFTYENLQKEIEIGVKQLEKTLGIQATDKVENLYSENENKIPLNDIREKVYNKAAKLVAESSPYREEVSGHIVSILKGIRISETTEANYTQLELLLSLLDDYPE